MFIFIFKNNNEPLFTRVRRGPPGLDETVSKIPKEYRHKHELRHMIPWSMLGRTPVRSIASAGDPLLSKSSEHPKSAGAIQRKDMDDRRLKELLEELYKDKKYFDHVIETTGKCT